MELEAVIEARLARDPGEAVQGCRLLYRMWALRVGDELAAVRDATAIVRPEGTVVVHLSHVVVAPAHRRTGVAALLRAVPVRLAREAWTRAGRAGRPNEVVLVAEMEPWDAAVPDRVTRLRAYATAGFSVIEPVALRYRQPDFRSPAEIDAGGGACLLPMWLLVRRVGREEETVMPREEVRAAVGALYAMYGAEFRRRDMALVWADWRGLDRADSRFALHSPIAIRTP
jgi:GNAT superfamily N-acetyltransferase